MTQGSWLNPPGANFILQAPRISSAVIVASSTTVPATLTVQVSLTAYPEADVEVEWLLGGVVTETGAEFVALIAGTVQARVFATNDLGRVEALTPEVVLSPAPEGLPQLLTPPAVTGTLEAGEVLTRVPAVWEGADTVVWDWELDGVVVQEGGETVVGAAGAWVLREIATNPLGSVEITYDFTIAGVVVPEAYVPPTLTFTVDDVAKTVAGVVEDGLGPFLIIWGDGNETPLGVQTNGETSTPVREFSYTYASYSTFQYEVYDLAARGEGEITLIEPLRVVSAAVTNIATREVTVVVAGGAPNYTFSWGDTSSTGPQAGLTAVKEYAATGLYTITVTDGEATVVTVTVLISAAPTATATVTDAKGRQVTVVISEGEAPFDLDFNDGSPVLTTSDRTVTHTYATSGAKTVDIEDAYSRTTSAGATVPAALAVTIAETDTTNFIATVTFTTGTQPYDILWGDGSQSLGVTGASTTHDYDVAGSYPITVTDANGWVVQGAANFAVTGGALSISAVESGPYKVKLTISGGTANFTIQWDEGGNNIAAVAGVSARVVEYTYSYYSGLRTIKVTDSLGATATTTVTVQNRTVEDPNWQITMIIGEQSPSAATQLIGFRRQVSGGQVKFGDVTEINVAELSTTLIAFAHNGGDALNEIRLGFGGQLPGITSFDIEIEGITTTPLTLTWNSGTGRYIGTLNASYPAARAKIGQQVGVSGIPTAAVNQVPRWRSLYLRSAEVAGRPANLPQYLTNGEYRQETPQFFVAGAIAPSVAAGETYPRLIFSQDIAGPYVSNDGLVTLYPEAGLGLYAQYGMGLAFDPDDLNRIVGIFGEVNIPASTPGCYVRDPVTKQWTLLRRAARGGTDLNQARNQAHNNLLQVWPKTTGTDWSDRKIAYLEVESSGPPNGDMTADALFCVSPNGGASWTVKTVPTAMRRLNFYNLIQTGENTYWAYSSGGEWKTINSGDSWTQETTGRCCTAWHDPDDAQHRIVSVSGTGLRRTINGGTGWTTILANAGVWSFAVGGKVGDFRYIWAGFDSTAFPAPLVQRWNTTGAPSATINAAGQYLTTGWNRGVVNFVEPMNSHEDGTIMGRRQVMLIADPVHPARCYISGDAVFYYTDKSASANDSGKTWLPGAAGYHGVNGQDFAASETNPEQQAIGVGDVTMVYTNDYWNIAQRIKLSPADQQAISQAITSGSTNPRVQGLCILPDDAALPLAARGRICLSIGGEREQQACGYWDPGDAYITSFFSRTLAAGGGMSFRRYCDYDVADPNIIYNGRNRSSDAGLTYDFLFPDGRVLCGVSRVRGGYIFALNSGWNQVHYSPNGGNSWTTWLSSALTLPAGKTWVDQYQTQYRSFGVRISPHDDTKALFLVGRGGGDLDLMLAKGLSSPVLVDLNLFDEPGLQVSGMTARAPFLCWDPSNPRVIYAQVSSPGVSRIWRGTFDATYDSITWEDWNFNLSRTCNAYRLFPGIENEVMALSSVGTKIMFGTDGPRAAGNWLRAPSLVTPGF